MIATVPTKGKIRPRRLPHLCEAARRLGVTRHHLRLVAIGERTSPKLLAKYKKFLKEKKAGAA